MCGIVGYPGARPAPKELLRRLRRRKYRGLDAAALERFASS